MNYFSCSLFTAVALLSLLSSCYRMPDKDEFSVVPTVNNPSVTHEKHDNFIPGLGY